MKRRGLIHHFSAIFIGFFCLLSALIHADEIPADPYPELKESKQKVDSLHKYIAQIYTEKPAKAKLLGKQAYLMAERLHYLDGQKDLLYVLSNVYKYTSNLDTAQLYNEHYFELTEKSNDTLGFAYGYLQKGNILLRQNSIDTAEYYFLKSKELFSRLNYDKGLLSVFNALGIISKYKTYYDDAVNYYQEVLKYAEKLNSDVGMGTALINLGKIYTLMSEDSLAKNYFALSIPYNKKIRHLKNLALAYENIGIVEMNLRNFDTAMRYFDTSLEIQKKLENDIGINTLYINQGSIYIEQGEYRKALERFDEALKTFSRITYPSGYITALHSKATVLSKTGFYSQAVMLLDSSLKMATAQNSPSLQRDIYEAYYHHYLDRKNYKMAVEYQSKFYKLRDEIWNIEKEENISRLRLQYEKEKDQARILALTNENLEKDLKIERRTRQIYIFLFSAIGIMLIAAFLLIFLRAKSKHDNYLAMQRIRQLEKDKKLISAQFLLEGQEEERKRIAKELHDGIGVLLSTAKMQFSSIDGITPDSRPKINNATKLLELAATEVRKITHNMMPGLLTRYGFFEAVDDLIEQINESGTIKAEMTVEGTQERFSEREEFMLYRIVQEMINNTLKHAEAKQIDLRINVSENKLQLEYQDNGKGFNVEEKMNDKSLGLKSIKSRSNYLGGDLKLDTSPGKGTKYSLHISISRPT